MRILSITAGAATMYCGSCMRDNALAAELIRQGHDVSLLPFYTPTLTDEDERQPPGTGVFWRHQRLPGAALAVVPQGAAVRRSAGRCAGVINAFTRGSISVDPKQLGAMTVSTLRGEDGHQRKEIEKLLEFLTDEPKPDVANIPYTLLIALAAPLKRALGCPVVITLQGEDLFLDGVAGAVSHRGAWRWSLRRSADVDLFIAVSEYYAAYMRDYLGFRE